MTKTHGQTFTTYRCLKFTAFVAVVFATGWAAFFTKSEWGGVYLAGFCTAFGGAIGTLGNRAWEGCIVGFVGFMLGLLLVESFFTTMPGVRE